MKLLFIGDIFARPGRDTVSEYLPEVLREYNPDIVIANAENLTHGNGFSEEHISQMRSLGINCFTSGNHVWRHSSGVAKLGAKDFPVVRPANYPSEEDTPGPGYIIIEDALMNKILVVNLMGQAFMHRHMDSPFKVIDKILEETKDENLSAIIVDFHAEATSEKYALGFHLDGRVSAVLGTHTHVPTADLRILPEGTAYMSDVGMTGVVDSIIGLDRDIMLKRFITQLPVKHEPAEGGTRAFNAALIEIDEKSKKALNTMQIQKYFN